MTTITVTTSTTSQYTISTGIELIVAGGGNVSSASILSSGQLVVSGGVENSATVAFGGTEVVSTGSATGDLIFGTLSTVSPSVAFLTNEVVESGGVFNEYNSAHVTGTVVSGGGTFILSGNTSGANLNTTLVSGGTVELITAKATIGGVILFSGGGNLLETSATISATFGDMAVISGFGATDRVEIATFASAVTTLSETVS